jgi:mono/diheme cytochrome c family protein
MTRRRRALLAAIALLAALDAARSIYARLGAAHPTTLHSADPAAARPIAWPPGSDLNADAPPGERVYARHCAVCHGPDGHGNGPAAPSLHPRPRDFSRGIFKVKSTPGAEPPTLDDVRATIRHGQPGSSMPGWHDILSPAETDAVAEYVRSFGPHPAWSSPGGKPAVAAELLAAAAAEEGKQLYADLGCPACHGSTGRGDGGSATALKDVWGHADPPRDLTAPWTFRGGSEPQSLARVIAHGMSGTPMPGYAEVAEPAQIAAVVAYLRSIARPPPWEAGGTLQSDGQSADLVRRGAYLTRAGMCGLCHTPVDASGIYLADTHYLAGGMKVDAGAHGIFFSRNLTPDAQTGLGQWTVEQIATAIRTGHAVERRLNFWGMPWMVLGALTPDDALAIAMYLKTLPAVRNQVPLPLHYGFAETVARKIASSWPAVPPPRLSYYAGNFGDEQAAGLRRDLPPALLIWAQYLVVLVLVLVWMFAAVRGSEAVRPERSGGLAILRLVAVLSLAGGSLVIYRYPAINRLPSAPVISAFGSAIPQVTAEGRAPHEAALLQRGRYLYSIASCPYCHNGNGAGGGKVNWAVFGTTWTRNLTAHPSGLADWSDEAVLRAMTSGVGRDGRALHWQAMIWDHMSNYDLEDQRALLAYVRALPPVERALPAAVPPGANDCPGDTFWIAATNTTPGCDE